MKQNIPTEESYADLRFPERGVDLARGFGQQLPGTTRDGQNVRLYEPSSLRARGGSRPGIVKFISDALPLSYTSGSRLIQCLDVVVNTDGNATLANFSFDPPLITDPSDVGPPSSWPPGRDSRVPLVSIPYGGTGVPPYKGGKSTPVLSWADPAAIEEGTALGGTQLNAAATDPRTHAAVPGAFTYSPVSGTVLSLGLGQALRTTFVPTDTGAYNSPVKGLAHIDVIPPHSVTWVFIQGGAGSSANTAFNSPVTSGNLLIVASGGDVGLTVTDDIGTSYTKITSITGLNESAGLTVELALWYGVAPASGSNTVHIAGGANKFCVARAEFSGQAVVTILDGSQTHTNTGVGNASGVTLTAGTVQVNHSNEMCFAVLYNTSFGTLSSIVAGGDFASIGSTSRIVIYKIDPALPDVTPSVTANVGGTGGNTWLVMGVCATFKGGV